MGRTLLFPETTALGSALLYKIWVIQSSDNGACLGVKKIGKPCAGVGVGRAFAKQKLAKLYARFDEGG